MTFVDHTQDDDNATLNTSSYYYAFPIDPNADNLNRVILRLSKDRNPRIQKEPHNRHHRRDGHEHP